MFQLKPTRMTLSDLRPSLSYRVGIPTRDRAARHWVELVLASSPAHFFAPDAAANRTPETFVTFATRFPVIGADAIIHIPPNALLTLARAERIYAGAALFSQSQGGAAQAIIQPDEAAVYVAADGFSGTGLTQRFGFARRPSVTGPAPVSAPSDTAALTWAGDLPQPGRSPRPQPTHRQPVASGGPSEEGYDPMNNHQGFMHQGMYQQPAAPVQNGQTQHPSQQPQQQMPQNGQAVADYDDGFGTPPPAIHPAPAPAMPPATPVPAPAMMPAPAPAPAMAPGAMPAPAAQPAPAQQQGYAQPLDIVRPVFDSYAPTDVWNTLVDMWNRYESFSSGVADTSYFPFSAIVAINSFFNARDGSGTADGCGTGFFIGPNTILTVAHNFAADSSFNASHTATLYAGLNSPLGPGNAPRTSDALVSETIDPATAVTIHPLYTSSDPNVSRAHDLAIVQTTMSAPGGHYFRIANFSPDPRQKIAISGYGASSHGQQRRDAHGNPDPDWRGWLPTAKRDWKQHMDTDIIREITNGGEGIHYNLQSLSGNSGSPVFIQPQQSLPEAVATDLMQVVAVHSSSGRGSDNAIYNHGVLLTPRKAEWALAGGQISQSQGYHPHQGAPLVNPYGKPQHAQPMDGGMTAAAWVAVAGIAANASIASLRASSGDLTWDVQKMEGWMPAGGPVSPVVNVPQNTIRTHNDIDIRSPVYDGGIQSRMYAHFKLSFSYDGTGVGAIRMEPAPDASSDNMTGGMRIDMQIRPLHETFTAMDGSGAQVACVEVRMIYTYEWTWDNNDIVTVIHRFYGDGTYESHVRGGDQRLDATDTTYTNRGRANG